MNPITGIVGGCRARATSGHTAAPASIVENSRRLMPRPQSGGYHIVAGNVALCIAAKCSDDRLLGVNSTHYRSAIAIAASAQ
jgi:hypothetical protein